MYRFVFCMIELPVGEGLIIHQVKNRPLKIHWRQGKPMEEASNAGLNSLQQPSRWILYPYHTETI